MHWSLSDDRAEGDAQQVRICLHPARPQQYARISTIASAGLHEALAILPQPSHSLCPEEIYVRGEDLIVRFQQSPSDEYSIQLNWRMLPGKIPFAGGIELWLSVQTELLDTSPVVEVVCSAPGDLTWTAYRCSQLLTDEQPDLNQSACPAALACSDGRSAGVWLIDAMDLRHAELLSPLSEQRLRVRLFGHFMEKGVIRRARMRYLISSNPVALPDIAAAYQHFCTSPLPLTA